MARSQRWMLGGVAVLIAAVGARPRRAQEEVAAAPAPPAGEAAPAEPSAPAAEAPAPLPKCAEATSYKECKAACREQFPPKQKVESRDSILDRARLKVHGWWALGTGAALLAAGGIAGGVTLHLNAELAADCAGGVCPPARHDDLDRRDRLGVAATVLVAAGVGASAVGVLILAVFSRTPDPANEQAVAFAPLAGPGLAGGAWAWRF